MGTAVGYHCYIKTWNVENLWDCTEAWYLVSAFPANHSLYDWPTGSLKAGVCSLTQFVSTCVMNVYLTIYLQTLDAFRRVNIPTIVCFQCKTDVKLKLSLWKNLRIYFIGLIKPYLLMH